MVVGSIKPWVETMALVQGAAKVVTVDYNKIYIEDPSIQFLSAYDLADSWIE